jgi:hypothetical protein
MIRRAFWLMMAAALIGAAAVTALPTRAQDNPDCAGVDDYIRQVRTAQAAYATAMGEIEAGDVEDWTPEQLETGITAATTLTTALEGIAPPPAASQLHATLIESFSTWTDLLNGVQESGILGALSHLDAFQETSMRIDAEGVAFETACNVAFIDNDDDGTPEIGAGVQPTPITSGAIDPDAPLGSFENPIPVGEPANVGGGWQITVVAVRPDDTEAVLAENSLNEPPIEGRQFFVADVMVENIGTTPATFDGNFRLRATGVEGDYRAFAPDDRCGVVANEWEEVEIAPGEQVTAAICWSVPTSDVPNIRLYDLEAVTETRVYFSLAAADSSATPVAGTGVQIGSASRGTGDDEGTPTPGQ